MGLPVLAEHDSTGYTLSVNHPEVEGVLSFRCQAVAQAVMNFLIDFQPYAFVPRPESSQWTPEQIEAALDKWNRENPAHKADTLSTPELPPRVEALMDKASPPDPSEVLKNMEAHEERGA